MKPFNHPLSKLNMATSRRMLGVVLPVVLVVLTVLTGLVVTQIRRSTVDERLAANTRESVQMDSSAQTVLRWCEAQITVAPQNTAVVTANDTPISAQWAAGSANWTTPGNRVRFIGGALPGLNAVPACVIENATCELAPPISPTGQTVGNPACPGGGELDPRWRKFRLTSRVQTAAPDMLTGNRSMYAQSELRLFID